jgi:hypothetical protein
LSWERPGTTADWIKLLLYLNKVVKHLLMQWMAIVSLARVLLVLELACVGKIFISAKKSPTRTKGIPSKNGIQVFPTIFTLAAGFY